jgi:hypothetical protein
VDSSLTAEEDVCAFPVAEEAPGQPAGEDADLAAWTDWTDHHGDHWHAQLVVGPWTDNGTASDAVWGSGDGETGSGLWSPTADALDWTATYAVDARAIGGQCALVTDGGAIASGAVTGEAGCTRGVPRMDVYAMPLTAGDVLTLALAPARFAPTVLVALVDAEGCLRGKDDAGPDRRDDGEGSAGLTWTADAPGTVQVLVVGDCVEPGALYRRAADRAGSKRATKPCARRPRRIRVRHRTLRPAPRRSVHGCRREGSYRISRSGPQSCITGERPADDDPLKHRYQTQESSSGRS